MSLQLILTVKTNFRLDVSLILVNILNEKSFRERLVDKS